MDIDIEEHILDLDVLIYALRSLIDEKLTGDLIGELSLCKECLSNLKPKLSILDNFFEREKIFESKQNIIVNSFLYDCINPLKNVNSELLETLQQTKYPLPKWITSKRKISGEKIEKNALLDFELQLFDWMNLIREKGGEFDLQEFNQLKNHDILADIDMSAPKGTKLLGWLTYQQILEKFNYSDMRLNRTLDQIITNWKHTISDITMKNEFLDRKNGLLLVFGKEAEN
ncbi:MAG: hypothetical protein ACXAC7_12375 [Candidatus Hodarchaeales archaeon]|jgi:hypothetical protein